MNKLNKFSRAILAIAMMLMVELPSLAHDFSVGGIYYKYLDKTAKTVEVTYKGSNYDSYSNEYTGSVTIPSSVTYSGITYSVTSIGSFAFFECSGLTSVTIGNSVISIGSSAFMNCSGLTSVTIGNSVTSIGSSAFSFCSGLTSITIPNSVTEIGDWAFSYCSGLTKVSYNAKNCTTMGSSDYPVFKKCSNLKIINIGNDVKKIPSYAFYGCTSLTSIAIPNSVTEIGFRAFEDTGWYDNQGYGILYLDNCCLGYKGSEPIGALSIKKGTRLIGEEAFSLCVKLTSVTIPNSVTTIGNEAFSATGLNSVTIPNSVTKIGFRAFQNTVWYDNQADGILYLDNCCLGYKGDKPTGSLSLKEGTRLIGDNAFFYCFGLTSVTIPNSVTTIGDKAFSATGLNSVTIPNSVSSIGHSAFSDCYGLTSVAIPNSMTSIGERVFGYCIGLTSVIIPNSVTSIGDYAFYGCTGLTSITIPNYVTTIGHWSFCGCTGLTSVKSLNTIPPMCDWNSFSHAYDAILFIPEGSKDAYNTADGWKDFAKIQEFAGINNVKADSDSHEVARYDIHGRLLSEPTPGINIVKMSNGTTRKVIVK